MILPTLLIMGRNSIFDPKTNRWVGGRMWIVALPDRRIIRIPMFAIKNEGIEPGLWDVTLDLIECEFTRTLEQEEWRRMMAKEKEAARISEPDKRSCAGRVPHNTLE